MYVNEYRKAKLTSLGTKLHDQCLFLSTLTIVLFMKSHTTESTPLRVPSDRYLS